MNKFNIKLNIQNFATRNCIDHFDYAGVGIQYIIKKRWISGEEFGIYLKIKKT